MKRMPSFPSLIALLAVLSGCADTGHSSAVAAEAQQASRWLKGNLHTHSLWSDGNDFPEMIALWYRDNGYNFLALSDHNILSEGERWLSVAQSKRQNLDMAVKKYRERFPDGVETRTGEKGEEIRLQPLDAVKKLAEKPGQFIMIQSEEISDSFSVTEDGKPRGLPIHLNATNIAEVVKPQGGTSVVDVIRRNIQAVEEQAKRLNRPIVTHLNHPNFRWGIKAEELAEVVEERYFEIYNGHPDTNTRGDADHPSLEKLWDIANTIRLAQLDAAPLCGLATDDSHHYHTAGMNRATPGRGWIMLRARELTVENVMAGLKKGDFYASSGVTLREVDYDPATKTISIEIEPDGEATFTTRFVGTPRNFSEAGKTPLDSEAVGKTFATTSGTTVTYTLTGEELYVRAIINSSKPPAVPSYEQQQAQAWTQPMGWALASETAQR